MIFLFFIIVFGGSTLADKPCRARYIHDQSVVCVCTEDYCDTIENEDPQPGGYLSYMSSKSGLRFKKNTGLLQEYCSATQYDAEIKLDINQTYQTMIGFGGAVTDSASINWRKLTPALQKIFIQSYFGEEGIEYSMVRVPIGGCDFSTHAYAYNDYPENDAKLTNFSLALEDLHLKIPFIRAAMEASRTPILVFGSTWSPPPWMKTNDDFYGYSYLKPEYYQTYADYHLRFIEEYTKRGVPIWAITNGNEPFDGVFPLGVHLNSLGWKPETLGQWLAENLGPTIRNSKYNDTKILAVDDQRYLVPLWFDMVIKIWPSALPYLDGVATHWYADKIIPTTILSSIIENHPDKFLLSTEACNGWLPYEEKVLLGSWERAEEYIKDIIQDVNFGFVGWVDWNMCLDPQGGPNWIQNYVDSPVIVTSSNEFLKQPMFYAMGHFAKFVPRGSRRIDVTVTNSGKGKVEVSAFLTTEDTVAVVVFNGLDSRTNRSDMKEIRIQLGDKEVVMLAEPQSVTTIVLSLPEFAPCSVVNV